MQAAKAAAELDFRASLLRLRGKSLDQLAALDDEIGIVERDGGGAAVGEKLEAANFVEDAALGRAAQERAVKRPAADPPITAMLGLLALEVERE
jgi:hypothetical protein